MSWFEIILLASGWIFGLLMLRYGKWCYRKYEQEVKAHAGTVENYHKCATERNEYKLICEWYEVRHGHRPQTKRISDEWPDEII